MIILRCSHSQKNHNIERKVRANTISTQITFRLLTVEDAQMLLDWKNDQETRQWSGNVNEVAMDGHRAWLTGVVTDAKGKILRIAEIDGQPVGLVRTANRPNGDIEVHYTVAPDQRNRGIGSAMVTQFVTEFQISHDKIVLVIKEGNVRSQAIAARLGLSRVHDAGIIPAEMGGDGTTTMWEWKNVA